MTLPIIWRLTARKDLAEVIQHVASVNPSAARRLRNLLMDSVLPASEHPYLFPQSELSPGLRKIVAHPNYVVYYRVAANCIEVMNVVHARQNFP